MLPEVKTFWLPKQGNTAEEYEDAFSFSIPARRFGMADGATESSFADIWARRLAESFAQTPPEGTDLDSWLGPLQAEWRSSVPWDRLPWFAEEKAKNGAFSTLLGLELMSAPPPPPPPPKVGFWARLFGVTPQIAPVQVPEGPSWRAVSVGDSCLFQVRGDRLLRAFPNEKAEQFNARPLLLCSNPSWNHTVRHAVKAVQGPREPGDAFLLATDALSHWFLTQHEAGKKPWNVLFELRAESDFESFVSIKRKEGNLKNDDTTLMVVRWQSA